MRARYPILSAIAFAVLWTAFMLWWFYPDTGMANTVILSAFGTLLGGLSYWHSRIEQAPATGTRNRIAFAVAFAVVLTAFMWWSQPGKRVEHTVVVIVLGALSGALWYWLSGRRRPRA